MSVRKDLGMVTAYAYAVSKGYAGTEEQFATLMASYADVGQTAVDAALAAKASEDAAKASETASKASETAAATSAGTATTAAQTATQAAQTATTKAGEATTAATTATTKAAEAAQSATEAAASATTAGTAATNAQTAQTAAEAAQTAAETAQGAAEDAAESVEGKAAQIDQNTEDISLLKSQLQDISEVSGSGAETSVTVDSSDVRNGFATSTIGSNAAIAATSTKTKTIVKAVQVVAGRRYKFVIKNGSTVTISASRTLVFTNSSNVITEVLYYTNSATGNESTTIYHTPSNSGYVWIGVDFTYASVAAYEVAFTYTALDAVSRSYDYKNFAVNLLNPDDVFVNQACPLTVGSLITDVSARNGYISTKPIAVRAGEKYIFNAQGYLTNIIYADDGGYILSLNTLAANTPFTIPDGVFYMQYSFSQNTTYFNNDQWKDRVMLIKGESIPTYFLPYGKYAVSDATEVLSPIATLTGRKKKAYIILNFDAAEDAETGFFTYRKSLLDAYGLKGCPCLNRAVLNNDFDDWASELNKAQYFNLLKDGWDVGLYVSQRGDSMNESQWDTFLATVKTALSGLGIYNIVGFHCTGNNLTQDLFNALKKAEFKVVRSTTNTFQPSFYAPLVVTDETLIPIATMAIDANTVASDMKANIDNAISAGSTLALMAHLVLDTTGTIDSYNCYASVFTEIIAYIKSKVDAGDVEVITWRELYQMMNPHDSNEYDYNRLFKMYSASV